MKRESSNIYLKDNYDWRRCLVKSCVILFCEIRARKGMALARSCARNFYHYHSLVHIVKTWWHISSRILSSTRVPTIKISNFLNFSKLLLVFRKFNYNIKKIIIIQYRKCNKTAEPILIIIWLNFFLYFPLGVKWYQFGSNINLSEGYQN